MRRSLLALCALLVIGVAGALAAAPKLPVYLDDDGGSFTVNSNSGWRVGEARQTAPRVMGVREGVRSSQASFRQDLAYLWAPKCTPGRQLVRFFRTVELPGPATEANFAVDADAQYGGPFAEVQLFVNGRLAYTLPPSLPRVDHDRAQAVLFGFGNNELEVRVTKKPLPRGYPRRCNAGDPRGRMGVRFTVGGDFLSDLSIRRDQPAKEVFRLSQGTEVDIDLGMNFVNKGPSAVYDGRFRAVLDGAFVGLEVTKPAQITGPGTSTCTTKRLDGSAKRYEILCPLRKMTRNTRGRVVVELRALLSPAPSYGQLNWLYEVSSGTDDPVNDNNVTRTTIFCTQDADATRHPDCKA